MKKKLFEKLGISKGGSDIFKYEEMPKSYTPPENFGLYAKELSEHMNTLFPERETIVFHEIISNIVHIDINIMKPKDENDFYVLYTTGMSDLPMTLPDEMPNKEKYQRAELMMFLPSYYNFGETGTLANDLPHDHSWPIHCLKYHARFPHIYKTWLGWGHTIPNGPDYEPITSDTQMGGIVLLELGEKITPFTSKDNTEIRIYYVLPAYKEEIEYKLEQGMNKLNEIFIENKLQLVVDLKRENYCK